MNTLEPFVERTMSNKPNDVHGRAGNNAGEQATLPAHARRDIKAKQEGHIRPALYYTQAQQTATEDGVWESEDTVRHKLISKEEFPQG